MHLLGKAVSTHLLACLLCLVALKDLLNVESVWIGGKNIVLRVAGAKVWIHSLRYVFYIWTDQVG